MTAQEHLDRYLSLPPEQDQRLNDIRIRIIKRLEEIINAKS